MNACGIVGSLVFKLLQVINTAQFSVALLRKQIWFLQEAQNLGKLVVNACGIEVSLAHKLLQVFNTAQFLVAL